MNKVAKNTTGDIMQMLATQSQKNHEKVARKMRIAAEIADAMESVGLSKIQFAERMNQQPSVITKWLSGTHNFTSDTLSEISTELGVAITGITQLPVNSRSVKQTIKTSWGVKPNYRCSVKSNSIASPLYAYVNYEPTKQYALYGR